MGQGDNRNSVSADPTPETIHVIMNRDGLYRLFLNMVVGLHGGRGRDKEKFNSLSVTLYFLNCSIVLYLSSLISLCFIFFSLL